MNRAFLLALLVLGIVVSALLVVRDRHQHHQRRDDGTDRAEHVHGPTVTAETGQQLG